MMKQAITMYRTDRAPECFRTGESLTAEDIVPEFEFPVTKVFE